MIKRYAARNFFGEIQLIGDRKEALERLADYEDTGLEPREVRRLLDEHRKKSPSKIEPLGLENSES